MEEGNRLFAARQWEQAKAQYEAAINAQPSLAEAHYNLALVIDILGDGAAARRHYIEAANLAPGHKVIWDSPPLRRHGLVDPTAKSDTLTTPSQSRHEP
jgi:Flp pilus assembly protein TadD